MDVVGGTAAKQALGPVTSAEEINIGARGRRSATPRRESEGTQR